jgi:hypothetical protein
MQNAALHETLEAFATEAAYALTGELVRGAEIQFEVFEERGRRTPLYCYRPLTTAFIRERVGLLSGVPSYVEALRALGALEGVEVYLRRCGESRPPRDPRARADAALVSFLAEVFADSSDFELEPARFEAAYAELERVVYQGRCVTTVIVPVLGIAFEHATTDLIIDEELSLVRGDALPDAPADAVWGDGEEPQVLAVLTVTEEVAATSALVTARGRFRRILTGLRLFERGGYALGPLGWTRSDSGPWNPVAVGGSGRPRFVTFISASDGDELRALYELSAQHGPVGAELGWALARFEMGCERLAVFEGLTDYLLALRALLEPEGPASGRLAGRLAALCAEVEDRPALAERTAHAISLERAVIAGLAPAEPGVDALVDELAGHLRALLKDVLCGHLESDLRTVADELLVETAAAAA